MASEKVDTILRLLEQAHACAVRAETDPMEWVKFKFIVGVMDGKASTLTTEAYDGLFARAVAKK